MNNKFYTQLTESLSFIVESSTAAEKIKDHPGGRVIVRSLHTDLSAAHDQHWKEVDKVSWSYVKSHIGWIIMLTQRGTAAILYRPTHDHYEVHVSTGATVETFSSSRGGHIVNFIKDHAGTPRQFFVSTFDHSQRQRTDKKIQRQRRTPSTELTPKEIAKRLSPIMLRALTSAMADKKGLIANMIKNDSFKQAKKQITQLEKLEEMQDEISRGFFSERYLSVINGSVWLSAAYLYPEDVSELRRNYGTIVGSGDGRRLLLKDIEDGNLKNLGVIIGFIKRELLTHFRD